MSTTVKYFKSTMTGAPSLANVAGNLIGVLDACLCDGFNAITLDSLEIEDDVATATCSSGHGFTMTGNTGPVIRIAGATPSALNGDWRITVTSTTEFTFATSSISDQTATGTITAKFAPAGFTKVYSGTNKAVYRADDLQGTRLYLRVDDSGTTDVRLVGYETMSNVDTGTGDFPTAAQQSGGLYCYKSSSGTARAWTLVSDGRMVYFFCDASGTGIYQGGFVFGDLISYASPDGYACILIAATASANLLPLILVANATGAYLARTYAQTGTSIASARYSHVRTSSGLGYGGQANCPALADNAVHFWPVEAWESTTIPRGLFPGLWNPNHNTGLTQAQVVENIVNLTDHTVLGQISYASQYQVGLDITGPWR